MRTWSESRNCCILNFRLSEYYLYMEKLKNTNLLSFLQVVHKIGLKGTKKIWTMHFVAAIFGFRHSKRFSS